MKLREEIRNLRYESRLRQQDVADKAGVVVGQVTRLENGKNLTLKTVDKILRVFGKRLTVTDI